jgi:hypothetical protein
LMSSLQALGFSPDGLPPTTLLLRGSHGALHAAATSWTFRAVKGVIHSSATLIAVSYTEFGGSTDALVLVEDGQSVYTLVLEGSEVVKYASAGTFDLPPHESLDVVLTDPSAASAVTDETTCAGLCATLVAAGMFKGPESLATLLAAAIWGGPVAAGVVTALAVLLAAGGAAVCALLCIPEKPLAPIYCGCLGVEGCFPTASSCANICRSSLSCFGETLCGEVKGHCGVV